MKKLIIIVLAVSALCVLLSGLSFADEAKKEEAKKVEMSAGQKVFTDAKCQMCHTVYAAGVGEPPAEDAKKEDEEEAAGPPDLSLTGAGKTAEWMSLFLQKKDTLNDKKHMKKFKGSDEDLTALVDWLLTLKPAEKVAPKAEKAEKVEKTGHEGCDHGDADKAEHAGDDKDSHEGHDHGDHDTEDDAEAEKGK